MSEERIHVELDEDLSDRILRRLAAMHPRRPTRSELIACMEEDDGITEPKRKLALAKRLGWLISNKSVEETLTLNNSSARIGLSGTALIGVALNIQALRQLNKTQHRIIDEILEKTSEFVIEKFKDRSIPPIVVREAGIVHGSDQIDIMLTILYDTEITAGEYPEEAEGILTYYVRDVLQTRVEGVSGTRSMILASSKAYPMYPTRRPTGAAARLLGAKANGLNPTLSNRV